MLRKIFLIPLIILIAIQFVRPAKNAAQQEQVNSISRRYSVPTDVKSILDKACFDCHSNNTRYPWYSKIQPVAWWLNHHINEGKKALNFDEYTNRSLRYQFHKLEEVEEQVKKDEMPLNSYTWIHKDALLTQAEKNTLISWSQSIRNEMKAKYPADSLIRKK